MNTFVDPRVEGGEINKQTTEDLVEIIKLGGEEWLWYKPFPVDVALIRGTAADEKGNISIERETVSLEILPIAQAAKRSGGIVIVQVERIMQFGSLNPMLVKVPGIIVDYIVVAEPEQHKQALVESYNPTYSGESRVPLDIRKLIARRVAMQLMPNSKVNLGIGIPEGVAMIANEESVGNIMTLTVEAGPVGGVPAGGLSFWSLL